MLVSSMCRTEPRRTLCLRFTVSCRSVHHHGLSVVAHRVEQERGVDDIQAAAEAADQHGARRLHGARQTGEARLRAALALRTRRRR